MSWTLEHSGVRKSLAYWSISAASLSFQNLGQDNFTFNRPAADAFAAHTFAHGDAVILRSGETGSDSTSWTDGTIRFQGEIIRRVQITAGAAESYQYQAAGPWFYLTQLIFEHTYKVFAGWTGGIPGSTPILNDQSTSHVVLNQSTAGALQGTQDTLAEILDWAIADGAPIQYTKANLPDMKIPKREQKEILCSEAIIRQLDYMDAVTWFDYSTTPPTFNCKRRSGLAAASLALDGTSGVTALGVTPRDAVKVPFVAVRFEKAYQDTYGTFIQTDVDFYPDPLPASKRSGLIATITLAPTITSTLVQQLTTAPIDETSLDWWKQVKPELNDSTEYNGAAIVAGSTSRTGSEANYIVDGAVADWMDGTVEDDEITAKISYTQREPSGTGTVDNAVVREKMIKVRVKATDLASGTYKHVDVEATGETPADFTGIAQTIYNDLNTLAYDGQIDVVESEPTFAVSVGKALNLTGGLAAWTTMAAVVQSATMDVFSGKTSLQIGPPPHLDANKIVDLLRVNRTRVLTHYSAGRASGTIGAGQSELPSELPRENTTQAAAHASKLSASGAYSSGQYRAELHATDSGSGSKPAIRLVQVVNGSEVAAATAGKILLQLSEAVGYEIRLRWYSACKTDGTEGYVLALGSPFIASLPGGKTDELAS